MLKSYHLFDKPLEELPQGKLLITTLNEHSYNVARKDPDFNAALKGSEVLLPDGISVVGATRFLTGKKLKKIAGEDLFYFEMKRLQKQAVSGKGQAARAMFLGSTEKVLAKIKNRAALDFPNVEVFTYSPPYKPEFSEEDNAAMYKAIEEVQPDVLFIGMTAPKQEKWAYKLVNSLKFIVDNEERKEEVTSLEYGVLSEEKELKTQNSELITPNSQLPTHDSKLITPNSSLRTPNSSLIPHPSTLPSNCHVCCIGAVFDFYAGTIKRAPHWMIGAGMEWLYRLEQEPKRLWRRYLIGNVKFTWAVFLEVIGIG